MHGRIIMDMRVWLAVTVAAAMGGGVPRGQWATQKNVLKEGGNTVCVGVEPAAERLETER